MQTFRLTDGDIVLASGSYATVTGQEKLRQDLLYALAEPLGIDRFHPRWGSVLPNFIGEGIDQAMQARIVSEARRIITNYAAVQRDRLGRDAIEGKRARYGAGEVVSRLVSVDVRQEMTKLHLRIVIQTASRAEIVLVSTLEN